MYFFANNLSLLSNLRTLVLKDNMFPESEKHSIKAPLPQFTIVF